MTVSREPMLDIDGRIMFCCGACGAPLTKDDFFDLGLRLPENGESKSDYCAAELIDSVEHVDCLRAARAG